MPRWPRSACPSQPNALCPSPTASCPCHRHRRCTVPAEQQARGGRSRVLGCTSQGHGESRSVGVGRRLRHGGVHGVRTRSRKRPPWWRQAEGGGQGAGSRTLSPGVPPPASRPRKGYAICGELPHVRQQRNEDEEDGESQHKEHDPGHDLERVQRQRPAVGSRHARRDCSPHLLVRSLWGDRARGPDAAAHLQDKEARGSRGGRWQRSRAGAG